MNVVYDPASLPQILYVLEALAFGILILYGYSRRRRNQRSLEPPTPYDLENAAPFELFCAVGTPIQAEPYSEIAPGLCLGFDAVEQTRITYEQIADTACAQHRLLLRINMLDLTGVTWLHVQRSLHEQSRDIPYDLSCILTARANKRLSTEIALLPQPPRHNERLVIGRICLEENFQTFRLTSVVRGFGPEDKTLPVGTRIVLVPELRSGASLDIKEWDIRIV